MQDPLPADPATCHRPSLPLAPSSSSQLLDDNAVPEESVAAMKQLNDPGLIYIFGMIAEDDKKNRTIYYDRLEKWNTKTNQLLAIIKPIMSTEVYDDIKAKMIELNLASKARIGIVLNTAVRVYGAYSINRGVVIVRQWMLFRHLHHQR